VVTTTRTRKDKMSDSNAPATQRLSGTYIVDRDHSSLHFAVEHMRLARFRASFEDVHGRLTADPAGVAIEGSAPVRSISIKAPAQLRDQVIRGFFLGDDHPEVIFRSTEVELDGDQTARVTGELTMRGVARTITAAGSYRPPIDDPYGSQRAALELRTTIDRRDWGIDWQMPLPDGSDAVGWEVELSANLELVREA
jgi:polyisoprenoid-binding protein YceI